MIAFCVRADGFVEDSSFGCYNKPKLEYVKICLPKSSRLNVLNISVTET